MWWPETFKIDHSNKSVGPHKISRGNDMADYSLHLSSCSFQKRSPASTHHYSIYDTMGLKVTNCEKICYFTHFKSITYQSSRSFQKKWRGICASFPLWFDWKIFFSFYWYYFYTSLHTRFWVVSWITSSWKLQYFSNFLFNSPLCKLLQVLPRLELCIDVHSFSF